MIENTKNYSRESKTGTAMHLNPSIEDIDFETDFNYAMDFYCP